MAALIIAPEPPLVDLVRAVAAHPGEVLAIAAPVTVIVGTLAVVFLIFYTHRWWG